MAKVERREKEEQKPEVETAGKATEEAVDSSSDSSSSNDDDESNDSADEEGSVVRGFILIVGKGLLIMVFLMILQDDSSSSESEYDVNADDLCCVCSKTQFTSQNNVPEMFVKCAICMKMGMWRRLLSS